MKSRKKCCVLSAREIGGPPLFFSQRNSCRTSTGKKTPGGAGTHTGHTGTRITQTNLTTIQTHHATHGRPVAAHTKYR